MQESILEAPTLEQSTPLAVEMRNITKTWPGVVANDHVNLKVRKGEIHALMGENGAGKTTQMNILYGLIHPESGEIYVNGQLAHITGPRDAIRLKIGMVHQHFMLIPDRKSTRLNSSHTVISYAVFCLKKKKNK